MRVLLDRALSASAGVVALTALAVSIYQAWISRQQVRMSAWPYVTQGNTGGPTDWAWVVSNVGLGPALVRSMRLDVDGKPVGDWGEFGTTMLKLDESALKERLRDHQVTTSTIQRGTVLLPGTTMELLRIRGGPFAGAMRGLLNDGRVSVRFCYCSLYQECWVNDSRAAEPVPVRECPAAPAEEFRS